MIMKDMVKALKAAYLDSIVRDTSSVDSIVRDTSSAGTCTTMEPTPAESERFIPRDAPVEPCTSRHSTFTVCQESASNFLPHVVNAAF
jgi:hypothetical protein